MSRKRRSSVPRDPVEITIQSLSHDGRGVAQIEGKTVFSRNALPGETVSFRYLKRHGQYDEGIAESVIANPAPERIEPLCEHFGVCGGCSLQHLSTEQQINHKQHVVKEQLEHFGKVTPTEWLPPLLGPIQGYRHKARVGVKYVHKKGKLLIGFRELNGRFLADLNSCQVLHESVGLQFDSLREWLLSLSLYEHIPQLEIAVDDRGLAIIIRHMKAFTDEDLLILKQYAEKHDIYLYLQPKGLDSIHCVWPEENTLLRYSLPAFDLHFDYHPCDFTQVNPEINQTMVSRAIEHLDIQSDESVLDLFCGIGNFTLPLARQAKTVVGVEGLENLVVKAKHNAALNQLENVEFHCADLTTPLKEAWAQRTYDKLLLDPARTGADKIMNMLSRWQPKRILYVSCNPATLARDAGLLAENGYKLSKCGVMDMFPHTTHVESMALFERE